MNENVIIVYKHDNSNIEYSSNILSETIVTLDPVDLNEWDSILVNIPSFIQDTAQNVMPEYSQSFKVQDTTFATIVDSSLSDDNIYFYFTASEGLFSLGSEYGDLVPNDFNVVFSQNIGGNAANPTITDVRDNNGLNLNSTAEAPDSSFRLTLSLDGDAAGVEQLTIKPQNDNIFDRGGNQLDPDLVIGVFTLFDKMAPTVTFTPLDGSVELLPTDPIIISFSEAIRLINNNDVTNDTLAALFTLLYTDGDLDTIPYAVVIDDDKKVITITPDDNLTELRSLRLSFGSNLFEDANDNSINSGFDINYTVKDVTAPVVESSSIADANAYILSLIHI